MKELTFKFRALSTLTGLPFEREATFRQTGESSSGALIFQERIDCGSRGFQLGCFGYVAKDEEEFEARWRAERHEEFKAWLASEARRIKTKEDLAEYDRDWAPTFTRALAGLTNAGAILGVIRGAVEWHEFLDTLKDAYKDGIPNLKEVRHALKENFFAARENVREEYADQYAEADDKVDFYDDFADDIAESFARNFC